MDPNTAHLIRELERWLDQHPLLETQADLDRAIDALALLAKLRTDGD